MIINIARQLNTLSALSFLQELNKRNPLSEKEVTFHFDCNWVCPLGMLLSIIGMKSCRNKFLSIPFFLTCNRNSISYDYASYMGFFKSISKTINIGNEPGQARGNENYVPITILDFNELLSSHINSDNFIDIEDSIEMEAKRLSKVLCRSDDNMQKLFTYIIREILRNIPEHSEAHKAFICAQYWRNGEAEIAILDEGIGIKNSLRKNNSHKDYIKSDFDALVYAIQPGISQAFSPDTKNKSNDIWANSGYGLYITSEICKELNGEFWIISGNKALKIYNSGIMSYDTLFDGTAIGIRFKTSKLNDSQKLITEISKRGEEKAKNIRNAFRDASEPSKSLIMTTLNIK